MNTKDIIKELRSSRGHTTSFLGNFLSNFSRAAILMHSTIAKMGNIKYILEEAIRNYIISITSCLETFYRDLYVYVFEQDENTLRNVLPLIKEKTTLAEMHDLLREGVTINELVSTKANFQNIAEIDHFVSKLFQPKGYFTTLDEYEHECFIPSISHRPVRMKLYNGWMTDFAYIFSSRHSFVHDANRECDIPPKKMAHLETLALQVAQMTSSLIAKRFGGKGMLVIKGLPAFLTIQDLISDEWTIEPEDSEGAITIIR